MLIHRIAAGTLAAMWLYQGLWCKVLGGLERHRAIVASVIPQGPILLRVAVVSLGLFECFLAAWILWGKWRKSAAIVQTFSLAAMNGAALLWARNLVPDWPAMVLHNAVFLALAWMVAEERCSDA